MTDNCPRCLASTEPQTPADDPQRYICRACGHSWTTSRNQAVWAPSADDYAIYDDPDAWEANDAPDAEPWWHDQGHDPRQDEWDNQHHYRDDTEGGVIARILARNNQTTYTVERADDPTD